MNKGYLIGTFGISVNQSSTDLNRYLNLAPENIEYDKSAKTFARKFGFEAQFLESNASRYPSQLWSMSEGIVDTCGSWLEAVSEHTAAPTSARDGNGIAPRTMVAAIRRNEAIEVRSQSLSQPAPHCRWIAQHAVSFDGFHWHARAFCKSDTTFKDLLLSSILDTRGSKPSETNNLADADWHKKVSLEMEPHPYSPESRQNFISLDYCIHGDRTKKKVREALPYYALRRLGFDTDPFVIDNRDQQLVLLTKDEVLQ